MKKVIGIIILMLVLCGCVGNVEMKVEDKTADEHEEQRINLSETFIQGYVQKNLNTMKSVTSDRFSFNHGGIDMVSDEPGIEYGTLNIIGENLKYSFNSSFEKNGANYYIYDLDENDPSTDSVLNHFRIQIAVRNIDGYWKVDDLLVIFD